MADRIPAGLLQEEDKPELPEEYFFILGRDPGLSYFSEPEWVIRRSAGARVCQYAASEFPEMQALLDDGLDHRWSQGASVVFEVNTVPVLAEHVEFRGGSARIGGKYLLNGASGDRVYTRYLKHNPSMPSFRRANRYFSQAKAETDLELPVTSRDLGDVPVGIECRNRRNYYHFMTESFAQLVHFADARPKRISFHCRGAEPSGFSAAFVNTLFPELVDCVEFIEGRESYDNAALALNFRHILYANGDPRITTELERVAADPAWEQVTSHARRRNMVLESTFDSSLRLTRERALKYIPKGLIEKFPRKIWVSRDNRAGINQRPMVGEAELFAELQAHGFERIYFEHLSPLEQIAAIQAADSIISMHGAFFANMMFARPETHFIELGTLQIQRHRWGDFLGNAHSAQCRYSTVFVDAAEDEPSKLRPISTGMSPVQVGRKAIDLIVSLI